MGQVSTLPPLTMTKAELAAYVGICEASVDQWRAMGHLPDPLPGTRRYLRRAVDAALDKAAGIDSDTTPPDADTPYARRQARIHAKENQGHS